LEVISGCTALPGEIIDEDYVRIGGYQAGDMEGGNPASRNFIIEEKGRGILAKKRGSGRLDEKDINLLNQFANSETFRRI